MERKQKTHRQDRIPLRGFVRNVPAWIATGGTWMERMQMEKTQVERTQMEGM